MVEHLTRALIVLVVRQQVRDGLSVFLRLTI